HLKTLHFDLISLSFLSAISNNIISVILSRIRKMTRLFFLLFDDLFQFFRQHTLSAYCILYIFSLTFILLFLTACDCQNQNPHYAYQFFHVFLSCFLIILCSFQKNKTLSIIA